MMRVLAKRFMPMIKPSLLAISCMLSSGIVTAAEEMKSSVADLRYGVALYHYYQQDYLQSLSELMVADARDGIHGHGNNPELIAGGISLAFGMQKHAEKLFDEILQDTTRPQSVRDAAWFYLGKLQYERADWAAAEQSFSKVSDKLSPGVLAEMRSLQINLQIKKNEFSLFTVKKVQEDKLESWAPYTLYNLGAANARAGDMKSAQEFFQQLAGIPLEESTQSRKEYLTLLDKTHTAIGYSYLQEKNYDAAIEEFRKVRLEGLESNQALLGYGWAAIAQQKYADAIKPWQVLQKRSLLYPAAQEALLALPFAYEKLNAPGDALHEYENAEQLLNNEISLVRDMRATLTQGELLTLAGSKPVSAEELIELEKKNEPGTLTALITDDGQNWLKLSSNSVIKTRSIYLRELFAQNAFQTTVLDLRDLLKLQKLLQNWQPKLVAYDELLDQKQAWRQLSQQKVSEQSLGEKETQLQLERDTLVARLNKIKANDDYMALADEKLRKSYAPVERSAATIAQMKQKGFDTSEYEDRMRMFNGILMWRAAQDYPANLWDSENAANKIDQTLNQIRSHRAKIQKITETGVDLQPLHARIAQQQAMVKEQLAQVENAINERGARLQAQVDKQLEGHEKRLNRYLAQSHLAVARLYDTALRKQAQ